MLKVAIIDSGVEGSLFEGIPISQYRIYEESVEHETPTDYVGHGTAVTSILLKSVQCEILSICPGIGPSGMPDRMIAPGDIAAAIRTALDHGADVLNISMGVTAFSEREELDRLCAEAYEKGVPIICAQSSDSVPSLPWACKGVLRVRASKGNTYDARLCEEMPPTVEVTGDVYRIVTREGRRNFATGNSYAAPFLVNRLLKALENDTSSRPDYNTMLKSLLKDCAMAAPYDYLTAQKVDLIRSRLPFIREEPAALGRVVMLPFSKEMHVIIRNLSYLGGVLAGVVDPVKLGNNGKDPAQLIGLEESEVRITGSLDKIAGPVDKLVIGYLDQVASFDSRFVLDAILEQNLQTVRANVFTFTPPHIRWKEIYAQAGLKIEFPTVIGDTAYQIVREAVPYKLPLHKPVVGVFGTSSSQGKVTLQMNLKRAFERRDLRPFFLSTEHQGGLLGANLTFADGYDNRDTIFLSAESGIDCLQRLMIYADSLADKDLILVGGQSWLIPYNIEEQTFIRNAVFLEGVRPDLAVLTINPLLDQELYIRDTIHALKSIYKCRTVAMAFSDYTPCLQANGGIGKRKLQPEEIPALAARLADEYGMPCGCIMDQEYVDSIALYIVKCCQ